MNIAESKTSDPRRSESRRIIVVLKKLRTFLVYYVYAAFSCLFLFTVGFLRGRNRTFLYRIAAHFGPFDAIPNRPKALIPTVSVSRILPAGSDARILEPVATEGNVTLLELMVVTQLARQSQALSCFEIGTFDGRTALNLAANCGDNGKIYTLDLPKAQLGDTQLGIGEDDIPYIAKDKSGARFQGTAYEQKIVQLYGDSSSFDYAPYAGQMDFVFVDGAHSFDYVLNDSMRALDLLRGRKGIILWHDYDQKSGVTECLNQLYRNDSRFEGLTHIEGTCLACLIYDKAVAGG